MTGTKDNATNGSETMTQAQITKAAPTKLRSGDWGARVNGPVEAGDSIQITTKAGKTWVATVKKVVWSGNGVSIVATDSESPSRGGYTKAVRDARGYVTERGHYDGYCGYACPVSGKKCCPANGPCHDCQ